MRPSVAEDVTSEVRALVYELSRRLDEHSRNSVTEFGLTLPQANAIRDLGTPLTTRELAVRMCCEPSNVTFVIDRLEAQGLVERVPHPNDRRARHLVLTPKGVELRAQLLDRVSSESPLAHLSDVERDQLRDQLLRALKR
ncbi:MarR family winged helix-turn-helix transcriptional regulator [Lentzea indica]|uniref:MarR family winged helix-turn-helix transcriptional regulator n=1 Tax=Lentzea indica TaxID=2604800 RepID=UPI00165F2C87|nr:MarR family transcriptional regulator [Lentzea indica]